MKHHLITLSLLFFFVSQAVAKNLSDTTVFEGKLVDNLTDEAIARMPDIDGEILFGISVRFLDVSGPDPKEVDVFFVQPEQHGFYQPGDLYIITVAKVVGRFAWKPLSYMADTSRAPVECVQIKHLASSPHVLKDSGIKKLGVFSGTWRAWNTDSADRGKLFAQFSCQFSPDGQHLISDRVVTNGDTVTHIHSVYRYREHTDDYSMTVIGAPGRLPFDLPVAYEGDSLIYHSEYMENGKKKYARTLDIFISPETYIFLTQWSDNGWYWHTGSEGKAKKVDSQELRTSKKSASASGVDESVHFDTVHFTTYQCLPRVQQYDRSHTAMPTHRFASIEKAGESMNIDPWKN